jgi:hypothetical protein
LNNNDHTNATNNADEPVRRVRKSRWDQMLTGATGAAAARLPAFPVANVPSSSNGKGGNSTTTGNSFPPRPPAVLDGPPSIGGIYDGEVIRVMEYGAFIQLLQFRGRIEGLCHVSAIANERTNDPRTVLAPLQRVKVKVLTITAPVAAQGKQRIALSMKEVDQGILVIHSYLHPFVECIYLSDCIGSNWC